MPALAASLPGCSVATETEASTQATQVSQAAQVGEGTAEGADAAITSHWEYYSVTIDGETHYAEELGDGPLPTFSSEDGQTFLFSPAGDTVYDGTLTLLDDGTYEMRHGDNETVINAAISGDMLTITVRSGAQIVFKAES